MPAAEEPNGVVCPNPTWLILLEPGVGAQSGTLIACVLIQVVPLQLSRSMHHAVSATTCFLGLQTSQRCSLR